MSSHYDPIPVESDHEDNDAAEHAPMIEDDARTERTRSTDRSNFFHDHTTDSDEDPEEDPPSTDDRAPLLTSNSGARPFGQTTSPNSSVCAPPGFHIWEKTLRTLKKWREIYQNTPAPQMESSSAIRQEFLLDTTPIVVDKLAQHEEKLEDIEDAVMGLPGAEAVTELRYEIDTTDSNVAYVNDEVQALKRKVDELTQQYKNMDHAVYRMENKMWDCHTMTVMAMGTAQDNLRTFFGNHVGGGEN